MVIYINPKTPQSKKKREKENCGRKFMFFLFYKIINQFNCFSSTFIRCIFYFSILYFYVILCYMLYLLPIDLWGEFILFEFNEISIENLLQLLFTIFLGFFILFFSLFVCFRFYGKCMFIIIKLLKATFCGKF